MWFDFANLSSDTDRAEVAQHAVFLCLKINLFRRFLLASSCISVCMVKLPFLPQCAKVYLSVEYDFYVVTEVLIRVLLQIKD